MTMETPYIQAHRCFCQGYERCMESFRPADAPEGPVTLKEEARQKTSGLTLWTRSGWQGSITLW